MGDEDARQANRWDQHEYLDTVRTIGGYLDDVYAAFVPPVDAVVLADTITETAALIESLTATLRTLAGRVLADLADLEWHARNRPPNPAVAAAYAVIADHAQAIAAMHETETERR